MDFAELEAVEGLRWPWHSWPPTAPAAASLVVPTAVLCSPLQHPTAPDLLPLLPYAPLRCATAGCGAALNPFSRVHHGSARWSCPFCGAAANPFPRLLAPDALPAELFPTHSSVEYALPPDPAEAGGPGPPALVFVIDAATAAEELAVLKDEVRRVVQGLPEGIRVALVTFAASVWVHDLGFEGCARVVVLNGERELESDKVCEFEM
jgi:protein transport protein SEC23